MEDSDSIESMDNSHQIGIAAARMMEKIEEVYPDGVKVGNALIIVSVEVPIPLKDDETEEDQEWAEIIDYYSTTKTRTTQMGMIDLSREHMLRDYEELTTIDDEDDDD